MSGRGPHRPGRTLSPFVTHGAGDGEALLTGIKPTGIPHIANYIGAIRPALALSEQYDAYYFIADYHALTTVKDRQALIDLTYEVAAAWLAMGLDPDQVTLYRQSDLPRCSSSTWILGCVTPKGLMNRAHAYKAAVAEAEKQGKADVDAGINMGVYYYPVLMAADILLFSADVVPVGRDQSQHLEMTRDIAEKFNLTYGDVLTIPELVVSSTAASILGLDGRKMSKSYHNVLPLFAGPDELARLIRRFRPTPPGRTSRRTPRARACSRSTGRSPPRKTPSGFSAALEGGGMSWKELKDAVFELLDGFLAGPRERYRELMADKAQIQRVLAAGAERARPEAAELLARVRQAIGREPLSL